MEVGSGERLNATEEWINNKHSAKYLDCILGEREKSVREEGQNK